MKKISIGFNKQRLSMLSYKRYDTHLFIYMLLWFGLFLFERDEVLSFIQLVEVREDFLLLGDLDGARTPSLSATGKRITQWLKE